MELYEDGGAQAPQQTEQLNGGGEKNDFFARLDREIDLLTSAASTFHDNPSIARELKGLRRAARDLAEFAAKGKITHEDAEFAFKSELKEFIAYLNGRLC